uniref:RRM domain-containing protein n=1 Tax=Pseudo-nitzschia australis TaxID=44445 RepID=A0A7S4AHZ3_9STRA|mmetsp:Transcript_23171/g.50641  ORF Transcript_23171/g.50641 Transcript_23171/m.50641 type:complete len:168 (-) Transcript_23171:892-1395(-)
MSWTQVYVRGLSRSLDPSDEEIENLLNERYNLTSDTAMWAGPGTTLIKRDEMGFCRGYIFLSFYSAEGAAVVVDRVNGGCRNDNGSVSVNVDIDIETDTKLPLQLHAELSNPKPKAKNGKNANKGRNQDNSNDDHIRLRSKRKAPIRKHPVIISSNGTKTNLGNKTK